MIRTDKDRREKCHECGKGITDKPIQSTPSRHALSPHNINWGSTNAEEKFYLYYCSRECEKLTQKKEYSYWAELDRNSSDSECFVHEKWDNGMRIGKCSITGQEVRVEPMMPGNNSGQPIDCYNHFVLNKRYKLV